jgi:hypothetical protein
MWITTEHKSLYWKAGLPVKQQVLFETLKKLKDLGVLLVFV